MVSWPFSPPSVMKFSKDGATRGKSGPAVFGSFQGSLLVESGLFMMSPGYGSFTFALTRS